MRQYSKTSSLIRNTVIIFDFIVLNILFYIYVNINWVTENLMHGHSSLKLAILTNLAFVIAQYFFSTVVHDRRATSQQVLRQVTLLVFLQGVTAYLISEFVFGYENLAVLDIRFIGLFTLILYVGILFSRFIERTAIKYYRRHGHNQRHVVFVGYNQASLSVYDYLVGDPAIGYHIDGYYADEEIPNCPEKLVRNGNLEDFEKRMADNMGHESAQELYCSLPIADQDYIRKLVKYCNNNAIHFYYVPAFTTIFGHSFQQEIVGSTAVFTNYDEPLMQAGNKFVKRTFDVIMSLCVLLCLLPFIPIIALIIYIQSPGPIFFKQMRTGLNGRNFYCYKFRSMHVNKDADLVQATKNDPRKFAFGNFMRKTNIDELPQFFNVLKGDMSIVGPRPHMLRHTEIYRELIDKYMVRHFVKPGITGWAQVTGFRGETKELWQMEGRVQRDIWYIEHWSIWLDLLIMWKTAKQVVVPDKNAY